MSKIVEVAKSYLGQEEISGNKGFKDKDFEKRMKDVGFGIGQAWCSYFAELVWKEAGEDVKPFSGSAFKTYLNYEKAGRKGSSKPEVGALVVWRSFVNGQPQWTGHIGVVVEVGKDSFKAIEGNTNDNGSREGIKVALKTRQYNWSAEKGLRLIGFINPTI
jgi:CHAP domain